DHEMKGELGHLDLGKQTVTVRLENGIAQTFAFDADTSGSGAPAQPEAKPPKPGKTVKSSVNNLAGKEGSEVVVRWDEDPNGTKVATNIEVTQWSFSKKARRSTRS